MRSQQPPNQRRQLPAPGQRILAASVSMTARWRACTRKDRGMEGPKRTPNWRPQAPVGPPISGVSRILIHAQSATTKSKATVAGARVSDTRRVGFDDRAMAHLHAQRSRDEPAPTRADGASSSHAGATSPIESSPTHELRLRRAWGRRLASSKGCRNLRIRVGRPASPVPDRRLAVGAVDLLSEKRTAPSATRRSRGPPATRSTSRFFTTSRSRQQA